MNQSSRDKNKAAWNKVGKLQTFKRGERTGRGREETYRQASKELITVKSRGPTSLPQSPSSYAGIEEPRRMDEHEEKKRKPARAVDFFS
jgi:hypothetical protein